MSFEKFDRTQLKLLPINQRIHDLDLSIMADPDTFYTKFKHPGIDAIADAIINARQRDASVIFMMGAHVIRSGMTPYLIKLMEEGLVTHFALNGAGAIHDFEFAEIGATTESVAKYISEGQFGLWEEDGLFNDALKIGVEEGLGFGESIGKYIVENKFRYREYSLLAAAYRNQIPVTVHVGIGNDIMHEQPNCDGAITGEASYTDFLIYTRSVQNLENGVFLNFGSAVTGPEVYLKALAMARNVAHQKGGKITNFTTGVFDIIGIDDKKIDETPSKSDPKYYFRPWKTIMARTVADGGKSYYIDGIHRDTVSSLAQRLFELRSGKI